MISPQRFTSGSYGINFRLSALDDRIRQRRVLQVVGEPLAVMNSPPDKIDHRFSLQSVWLFFVNENVGIARDWIGVRAVRIGDRNTQIVRRVWRRSSGCCCDRVDRWFNKIAAGI